MPFHQIGNTKKQGYAMPIVAGLTQEYHISVEGGADLPADCTYHLRDLNHGPPRPSRMRPCRAPLAEAVHMPAVFGRGARVLGCGRRPPLGAGCGAARRCRPLVRRAGRLAAHAKRHTPHATRHTPHATYHTP